MAPVGHDDAGGPPANELQPAAPPDQPREQEQPFVDTATPEQKRARATDDAPYSTRLKDVFVSFLPMGFLAFGGPQAHIAMFLKTFVEEKQWLDQERFMELMSLGQAMPGPTSTQMATAMGISRAGALGGLLAFVLFDWVGFAVCITVGTIIHTFVAGESADPTAVNTYKEVVVGMGPAAISQVFIAAYTLGMKACGADRIKVGLAAATGLIALLLPSSLLAAFAYLGMMIIGGLITIWDSRRESRREIYPLTAPEDKELLRRMGMRPAVGYVLVLLALLVFVVSWLVALTPGVAFATPYDAKLFALFQTLYKMGITIYGGGQVVLPMLESEFTDRCGQEPNYVHDFAGSAVAQGGCEWVSSESFAFGLALAQSLPGPLFNFSAFLGSAFLGVPGGFVGFIGLFSPGILLIYAFMPFWEKMRQKSWVRCMLVGMNASSIGLVFTACVKLYFKYVRVPGEAVVMLLAMLLVKGYGVKAPFAIIGCAALGWALFALDWGGPYCHVATYGSYSTHDVTKCLPSISL